MTLYLCVHTLGGKVFGIGTTKDEAERDYIRKFEVNNDYKPTRDLILSFYIITKE